jgi:hypothetical protein
MIEFNEERKLAMYDRGEFVMQLPPVSPHAWTRQDWVRWIDNCGIWKPKTNAVEQAAIANARSRGE